LSSLTYEEGGGFFAVNFVWQKGNAGMKVEAGEQYAKGLQVAAARSTSVCVLRPGPCRVLYRHTILCTPKAESGHTCSANAGRTAAPIGAPRASIR
jgi:hypothetical protein